MSRAIWRAAGRAFHTADEILSKNSLSFSIQALSALRLDDSMCTKPARLATRDLPTGVVFQVRSHDTMMADVSLLV